MKKELYAALAVFTMCGYSSAQTVSVIGLDDSTIATYRLDQIKEIVFTPAEDDTQSGSYNGHDYVDLGLSVKWATCNVGANSPEEYGGYYAWGETSEKSDYSWDTYFDSGHTITTDIAGTEYDVAHVKWGGSWRMPQLEEIKELRSNCTWQWTTVNGVEGQKVTGPNGNSIFLPAAGRRYGTSLDNAGFKGNYWSSTPNDDYSDFAYYLLFGSGYSHWYDDSWRYDGFSIRPVSE